MPQFRSLSSFAHDAVVEKMEGQSPKASLTFQQSTTVPLSNFSHAGQQTDPINQFSPVSQPLDIPTTQSLISALQSATPRRTDQLFVIPGDNKRTRLLPEAQGAYAPPRRMRRRTRHGIALGTVLFVLILTMLTLAPLDGGQNSFHIFGGVAKWANAQQQDWNILSHTDTMNAQNNQPAAPPIAIVAGNPPVINLPTSQYVAIARQDAINAGIPPEYFVRQIYAESGFDPNAASGAGAVGIAQFEPATAAGLGINPYDPIQALSGAARLMASYAAQYHGNYAMALAAYNAGGGNLENAVARCGAAWKNCVPAETQNYIYKIMGI